MLLRAKQIKGYMHSLFAAGPGILFTPSSVAIVKKGPLDGANRIQVNAIGVEHNGDIFEAYLPKASKGWLGAGRHYLRAYEPL